MTRFRWFIIAAWIVLAGVVATLAPALQSTQDNSEFLPDHYESIQAAKAPGREVLRCLLARRDPCDRAQGRRQDHRRGPDRGRHAGEGAWRPRPARRPSSRLVVAQGEDGKPNLSDDGTVMFAVIPLAEDATGYDTTAIDDGKDLRSDVKESTKGSDPEVKSTGAVPQSLDSQESGEDTLTIVAIATVVLIVGLLALIFRSVLICLLPLVVVGVVSTIATGAIAWANDLFGLKADASVQQILVVVLYGVGTDYILFFLFRHRERLRQGAPVKDSVVYSLDRAGEAIASAGGAVIVAFMALILRLAEHLPRDRSGARDRGLRDPRGCTHPGPGHRLPPRQGAVLAVEVVEEGAQARHLHQGSARPSATVPA
ncbi:MMPL family transporter [Nocardioides sp. W3-2-3]|nr:MMPL family transporter [Nocardioides convexus]